MLTKVSFTLPSSSIMHSYGFSTVSKSTNLVVPQELSFDTWTQDILGKLLEGLVDILHIPICVVSCVIMEVKQRLNGVND